MNIHLGILVTVPYWAKISIPSITVNGVIVPVLDEPVGNLGTCNLGNLNTLLHVYFERSLIDYMDHDRDRRRGGSRDGFLPHTSMYIQCRHLILALTLGSVVPVIPALYKSTLYTLYIEYNTHLKYTFLLFLLFLLINNSVHKISICVTNAFFGIASWTPNILSLSGTREQLTY